VQEQDYHDGYGRIRKAGKEFSGVQDIFNLYSRCQKSYLR